MSKYLTVQQINDRMTALAAKPEYAGYVSVFNLSRSSTAGARPIKCLRIGNHSPGVPRIPVLIMGGIHAREWAPPDSLVEFAEKLLRCFQTRTAFVDPRFVMTNSSRDSSHPDESAYEGRIVFTETRASLFSVPDIIRVMDNLELYVVPTINPDGREFTQQPGDIPGTTMSSSGATPANKKWWRKNRHDLGTCIDGTVAIGVDLNRNFSTVPSWDYKKYYNASDLVAHANAIAVTDTKDSSADTEKEFFNTYNGSTTPENETQAIMDLVVDKNIKFFLDIHQFAREIYYPWSMNSNQTTDALKSQYNPLWDNDPANPNAGQRGRVFNTPANIATYAEFFPNQPGYDLQQRHIDIASSMRDHIADAGGSDVHAINRTRYAVKPSFELYASPGDSVDYVFSTQLRRSATASPGGNMAEIISSKYPVFSFTIEAGHESDGEFWPSRMSNKNQYLKVRREIQFAVIALIKYAATWSQPPAPAPPPPPPPSPSPSPPPPPVGSGCSTLIVVIGLATSFFIAVVKHFL
jgi:hypothetical protein